MVVHLSYTHKALYSRLLQEEEEEKEEKEGGRGEEEKQQESRSRRSHRNNVSLEGNKETNIKVRLATLT